MARVVRDGQENVRVLDIAKEIGVNKNSFYYHFATRQSVAYWIIRRDIAQVLEESFDPDYFVYVDPEWFSNRKDAFEELPYYVRVPLGARMLDQGRFLKELALKLRENQDFYRVLFQEDHAESTTSYLRKLFLPAMEHDVDVIADGRYLSDSTRRFLAACMMNMNFGIIKELVNEKGFSDDVFDDQQNPFWNIAAESLNEALRNHPIFNTRFLPENYRLL